MASRSPFALACRLKESIAHKGSPPTQFCNHETKDLVPVCGYEGDCGMTKQIAWFALAYKNGAWLRLAERGALGRATR